MRRNISILGLKACLMASTAFGVLHWSAVAQAESSIDQSKPTAEQQQNSSGAELAEILVTAQKRSERLMDVPMLITAETGDQLQKLGITRVDDLGRIVAGFTYQPTAYGLPIYAIRGIGFNDLSVAAAPTVGVYVDQIPLPYPVMTEGAFLDLERAEVLKGPQGTLFGNNSTGGAINYIAAKPTQHFEAGMDVSYGNFNAYSVQGFVSGPLANTVSARVALLTDQSGDWQKSQTRTDTLGQRNFNAIRILLDHHPRDDLYFELNANGWIDKSDTQAAQFVAFSPTVPGGYQDLAGALSVLRPAPNNNRIADWDPHKSFRRDDHFYQFSLHGVWDLSPSTELTSLTAYSNLKKLSPIDADGTYTPNETILINASIQSFFQELRLSGQIDDNRLHWMGGVNYEKDQSNDNDEGNTTSSSSGIGPVRFHNFVNQNDQNVRTKAVFGSLDYSITSSIKAQGSIRYTKSQDDFRGCLRDSGDGQLAAGFSQIASKPIIPGGCVTLEPPPSLAPVPIVNQNLDQNNTSWRAGLSWEVLKDTMLYANATKGYKAGNFSTIPALFVSQFNPVTQESVLAYEVGFKAALLNRKLQITGAAFYYNYTDKQLLGYIATAFGNLPGLVNIPKSKVRGAELDTDWSPVAGLTISGGATYIDSVVDSDFLTNDPYGKVINIKGSTFPSTPKWQFVGDVTYEFPVFTDHLAYFGFHGMYRTGATAAFGNNPDFEIAAYGLLDLRVGVENADHHWYAEAWGRNVTDKFYVLTVTHVSDTVARVTGRPGTFGIRAGYRFH